MTRRLGQRRPMCGWGATAIPAWSCTSLGPNRSTKHHAPAILLSLCGRNLSTSLRGAGHGVHGVVDPGLTPVRCRVLGAAGETSAMVLLMAREYCRWRSADHGYPAGKVGSRRIPDAFRPSTG